MSFGKTVRGGLLLLGGTLLSLLGAGPASAAAPLALGFSSDSLLVGGTSASRGPWISRAVSDGAGVVRVNVPWSVIAPSRPLETTIPNSPGYDWSSIDGAVKDLTSRGVRACLMLYKAPTWAEGPGLPSHGEPGAWRPNANDFAQFATAAATRYDGRFPDPSRLGSSLPRVNCWQGWNEPNINYYLSPQWVRNGNHLTPVAPSMYRNLLNAFYTAVKNVSPSNSVVMAGTAPIGIPPGSDGPYVQRTSPVAFYRELFCLNGRQTLKPYSCPAVHLDGIDHHPQVPDPPTWHAPNPDDAGVPDIARITRVLRAAVADRHVLPGGPKSIWVSELEWSSNPPSSRGVPVETAAHWYEEAFYELWTQGVDTIMPLELGDPPPAPSDPFEFQSGLYYQNGTAKPVATAYRFPFVISPVGPHRVRAWGRSPETGKVRIEVLQHGSWHVMRTLSVGRWGVFTTSLAFRGPASWRAQVGAQTSLTWTQGAYGSR